MGRNLHIIADKNIAELHNYFSPFGHIVYREGHAIGPQDLQDADALLVRSVTRVDARLIENSRRLRFVGSVTSGTDHIDTQLLQRRGIGFAHAPGSNADSVVEYILSVLAAYSPEFLKLRDQTIGIVGCGNIGGRLARRLVSLGCSVLACDPPLLAKGGRLPSGVEGMGLEALLAAADVTTCHVPLVRSGEWPTADLIGVAEVASMREGALVINTARGEVVSESAIRLMLQKEHPLVLDVWPGEPKPDPGLVAAVEIATPHIAGYAYDGKVKGTRMIRDALVSEFDLNGLTEKRPMEIPAGILAGDELDDGRAISGLIKKMYDVTIDSERFKSAYTRPPVDRRGIVFNSLRKNYPKRRSFDTFRVRTETLSEEGLLILREVLGIRTDVSTRTT